MFSLRPFSSPQAFKPSHADWLNDRSSTPPIPVTIAALMLEALSDDDESFFAVRLPQAAKERAATEARPRPTNFLFISEPS